MFIQIGKKIIAIADIASAYLHSNDDGVSLYEAAEGAAWSFYGSDAEAIKDWLKERTEILVPAEKPVVRLGIQLVAAEVDVKARAAVEAAGGRIDTMTAQDITLSLVTLPENARQSDGAYHVTYDISFSLEERIVILLYDHDVDVMQSSLTYVENYQVTSPMDDAGLGDPRDLPC